MYICISTKKPSCSLSFCIYTDLYIYIYMYTYISTKGAYVSTKEPLISPKEPWNSLKRAPGLIKKPHTSAAHISIETLLTCVLLRYEVETLLTSTHVNSDESHSSYISSTHANSVTHLYGHVCLSIVTIGSQ